MNLEVPDFFSDHESISIAKRQAIIWRRTERHCPRCKSDDVRLGFLDGKEIALACFECGKASGVMPLQSTTQIPKDSLN